MGDRALEGGADDYDIVRHPVMKNIRELIDTGCDLAFVAKLPRLEKLTQSFDHHDEVPVLSGKGWPALKELEVTSIRLDRATTVLDTALAKRLVKLVMTPSLTNLAWHQERELAARDERKHLTKLVAAAVELGTSITIKLERVDGVHAHLAISGPTIAVSIVEGFRDAQANTAQPDVIADVIAALAGRNATLVKPPKSPKLKKALESALLT